VEGAFGGPLDVVCRDLVSVVKAHSLAKKKAVRLAVVVDRPKLGDVGLNLPVVVVVDEPREHLREDLRSEAVADVGWVDRADIAEGGEREDAPSLRRRAFGARRSNRRLEIARARGAQRDGRHDDDDARLRRRAGCRMRTSIRTL